MIERYGDIFVVRDDLLPGGSKSRFVPYIIPDGTTEIVYGAPFCGGAPVAIAVEGQRRGIPVTIFYAQRKELTPRQKRVAGLGARLELITPGYMTVVQARARAYAAERGATFLPLGIDLPEAQDPFVEAIRGVVAGLEPSEVWCATGSGMLARCLALALPKSQVKAVAVGLASRWQLQMVNRSRLLPDHRVFPPNVEVIQSSLRFERKIQWKAPFDSCDHYDRKAWAICVNQAKPGALMWNVMGTE